MLVYFFALVSHGLHHHYENTNHKTEYSQFDQNQRLPVDNKTHNERRLPDKNDQEQSCPLCTLLAYAGLILFASTATNLKDRFIKNELPLCCGRFALFHALYLNSCNSPRAPPLAA